MKKTIITTALLTTLYFTSLNANISNNNIYTNNEVLVGFYGRPNASSLGILGENNINNLVLKMRNKQNYYKEELGNDINIKMAFHIIHSLATKDEGRRKDFLLNMSEKTVLKYIKRANDENFAVILDVQLGVKTPEQAIKPILKYLKYKNVHLAIDPEFKVPANRKYPPGKFIGSIKAKELNKAQELMSEYMEENNINEKRKLIVHMFHKKMLKKKEDVKNFENIQLLYNIDGHGNSGVKTKIYNSLYANAQTHKAIGGFKIFYKNDHKPLMTPKQILGWENVGSQKILVQPYYINYH